MNNLRGPEDGSTDTARESGSAYTRMHKAMTKGSFQAWSDMQPSDFCLAHQNPLITFHCCIEHNGQNTQQNSDSELE